MERVKLYFHSEAVAELEAAFEWYIERSPQAAERFLDAFAAAMATIRRNPQLCGGYLYGTRRYLLRKFPFLIVIREHSKDRVQIVAVAHQRRVPGYWRKRI